MEAFTIPSTEALPLNSAKKGDLLKILKIQETLPPKFQLRLWELGFVPGVEVECLQQVAFKGPKLFRVHDSVFSLSEELSSFIVVKKIF